jgi:GTP cyclohydrolase II
VASGLADRRRLAECGLDVSKVPGATDILGPAYLPLRWGERHGYFDLFYVPFDDERYVVARHGAIDQKGYVPLRIESACIFGHVFGSMQCDCGWQWRTALDLIVNRGSGLLIYGVDQDARGLGIAAHFKIYQMRQQEHLDTAAVFERLDAPLDTRDYSRIPLLLKAFGAQRIDLLSNNSNRRQILTEAGFDVRAVPLEADLTLQNMSTLMLEKEDLGYSWSFLTHADVLEPMQAKVNGQPELVCGAFARPGEAPAGTAVAGRDEIAAELALVRAELVPDQCTVCYLTDLPRVSDLAGYAAGGTRVIVVPYPSIPPLLQEQSALHGIRVVDWARRNAWTSPRPQWVPTNVGDDRHQYHRVADNLHLAGDTGNPDLTYVRNGSAWTRENCQ